VFVATIPFVIHTVLISYSRGAMVSMLAIVPVLILRSRRRWQFLMVAAVLGAMIPTMAGREIRGRFFSIDNYAEDRTANSRFQSWAAAIRIANDYPLLGVGIRNANLLSHQYGADQEGRTIHSQYLQILADEGYPGLGLYLLAIVTFFWNGWRVRQLLRKRTDYSAHRAVCMLNGVEGAFFMFCVGGAFLSLEVFELPYFMLLIGAQICAIVRQEAAAVPVPVPAPSVAPTPILAPARFHQTAR
jgi:probable O-glycosylation ligase (exosortase A-associated)